MSGNFCSLSINSEMQTFYRLDFRHPRIILTQGFKGTKSEWMNNLFGKNTVFASKSLKGTSNFYIESVMNRYAGGGKKGPLNSFRHLYSKSKCYIYQINSESLDFIDVRKDLSSVNSEQNKSLIYKHMLEDLEKTSSDLNAEAFEDKCAGIRFKLYHYSRGCAAHTEEVLIRGPIHPEHISLYQTLKAN